MAFKPASAPMTGNVDKNRRNISMFDLILEKDLRIHCTARRVIALSLTTARSTLAEAIMTRKRRRGKG
jgi:hypothetical protein